MNVVKSKHRRLLEEMNQIVDITFKICKLCTVCTNPLLPAQIGTLPFSESKRILCDSSAIPVPGHPTQVCGKPKVAWQ